MEEKLSNFKVLGSITAVQTRPGMFIGEGSTADHLGNEVLDNAFDEIRNNYSDTVNVFIENDEFWVSDNGRGIEVGITKTESGDEIDTVIAACTLLFSGTKFDLEEYQSLFGQNGVGLVAVNALSDWVVIQVRDRKNKKIVYTYRFENSEFIEREIDNDNNENFSTVVGFKPSNRFFPVTNFNLELFKERLLLGKSSYPNKTFILNGEEIENISVEKFAKYKLELDDSVPIYKIAYKNPSNSNEEIVIFSTYVESNQKTLIGDVNLRICDGTYLSSFQTALVNSLQERKEFKKVKVIADLVMGLRTYIQVRVPEPKFDSQTKVRMTLDIKKPLINPINDHIKWFSNLQHVVDTLTSNLQKKYGAKVAKKAQKNISIENKLRDCINSPGKVLYLCEGDSADGTLKIIRDKYTEASLPFKGKLINVEKKSIDAIFKNDEIKNLIEALGEEGNRRYEKVKILADADLDGAHIVGLMVLALQKFASDMIKEGRVSVIIPPLYGASKKNEYIPIYDKKMLEKYEKSGYTINRYKGLGEMDAPELEKAIRSGVEYIVTWPKTENDLNQLITIVTSSEGCKLLMIDPRTKLSKILDEVLKKVN